MRIRLTLYRWARSAAPFDGLAGTDVVIEAPVGTRLGELAPRFDEVSGESAGSDKSGRDDVVVWSGTSALRSDARLGEDGLRSGAILGIDAPAPRVCVIDSVLRVHVVAGPDSGRVIALPRGPLVIGRGTDCDLQLADADVSRQHLEVTTSAAGVSARDLGSTNGSTILADDGSPASVVDSDGTDLPIGAYVRIGETVLCAATLAPPSAVLRPDEDGGLVVNRPPRLMVRLPDREVVFDPPVPATHRPALPWLAALVAAIAGAGLAWFLHNIEFLAFVLLSPLVMMGSGLGERFGGRRAERRRRSQMRRRAAGHAGELERLAVAETRFRRTAHPDPVGVMRSATTPDTRIWERHRRDPDRMEVCVGLGDRSATLSVRRGSQRCSPPSLPAVPLVADLREGPLGICGPRALTIGLARWTITQLAALHSPADLSLVALIDDADAAAWDWMRWLPHVQPYSPGPTSFWSAGRGEQQEALLARLDTVLDRRMDSAVRAAQSGGDRAWTGPWIVLLVDRSAVHAGRAGLGRLLQEGRHVGLSAICIDETEARLPAACSGVASLAGDTGTRVRLRTAGGLDETALVQRVTRSYADQVARALCPLRDPGDHDVAALPAAVSLTELIGFAQSNRPGTEDRPAVESTRQRWRESDGAAPDRDRPGCRRAGRDRPGSRRPARSGCRYDGCGKVRTATNPCRGSGSSVPPGRPAVRAHRLQRRRRVR